MKRTAICLLFVGMCQGCSPTTPANSTTPAPISAPGQAAPLLAEIEFTDPIAPTIEFLKSTAAAALAPRPVPRQVHALWENRLVPGPSITPCFAGRMYLTGEDAGTLLEVNGSCTVDAYEILPDGEMARIERWEFDSASLKRVFAKDAIGWGYTLYLPFFADRADIQRVKLQTKVTLESGRSLTSLMATIAVRAYTR